MQRGVVSLSDFDSTAQMRKALDIACSQVVEKARQRERQYDAETAHGWRQGAVLR
jgi:predicted secreted Zn-dependent protease